MKNIGQILAAGQVVIVSAIVAASCAKIGAPSGGPKDTEPPVIEKTLPKQGTVMFSSHSFTVSFDEYFILDKITEKFMVSPPLASKPDIKIRGKDLVVSWDEKLEDSTTYTFYFQDAIKDNHENNPIPDFRYVFSTGPVLDSLSLSGNIFNGSDLEATADMVALLHSNLADSAPRKLSPSYIARPDPSGGFVFNNLKPGHYKLYALKDINGNKRYDLNDEEFGFYDTIIVVAPETNAAIVFDSVKYKPPKSPEKSKPDIFTFGKYQLHSFTESPKRQYLTFNERKSAGGMAFGLAMPLDTNRFKVSVVGADSSAWFMEHNSSSDTFRLWITSPEIYKQDVLKACVTYPFTDSTGTIVLRTDTVSMRHQSPPPGRVSPRQPKKNLTTNLGSQMRPGTNVWFSSSMPLREPDTKKISLTQTIDSVTKELPVRFVKDSLDSRRYFLNAAFKPGAAYQLVCRDSSFTDLYGVTSDSMTYKFVVMAADNYGSIKMNVTGYEGDIIVQLLGDKEKVIREQRVKSPASVTFNLLDKGRYRLKVIYDLDGNGEWTTGNFSQGKQPEPVTYYKTDIEAKINWSIEEDWDINRKFVKDVSLRNKPETKK